MTINEAILKSLAEINGSANSIDIYQHIEANGYYDFKDAKTPENTISSRLGDFIRNKDFRISRIKQTDGRYLYSLLQIDNKISSNYLSSKHATMDDNLEYQDIQDPAKSENEDFYSQEDDNIEIEPEQRKIYWQPKDYSIREFLSMEQDGELILQPEYQRNFVASSAIASKLIESILLDVPIPVIYLAQEKDGTFSVIDGQQRLTAFLSYVKGKYPNGDDFKLTGLKVLSDLNRKKFPQLDKDLQTKIKTTTLHSIIIKNESNEDIKFEIFERLNTGSIKLNEDEIRNTVYRGNYIKLLKELSENPTFHEIIKKDNFMNRMIYRGMILRFFALSEKSYINYRSSMKQFCNKELRDNRNLSEEKALEYKARFEHCLDLVKKVFGSNAFRRYIPGNDSEGGKWSSTLINMGLFDLQMIGFVNYSKNEVLANADAIREGLLDLMTGDVVFQELIGYKTSNTDNVKKRFKMYMGFLEKVIGDKSYQQRIFSFKIKEDLFNTNPYCAISKQKILAIEDAEVDHIIPYSKGGKTEKENAQLVLRYFNRAKKDKEAFA